MLGMFYNTGPEGCTVKILQLVELRCKTLFIHSFDRTTLATLIEIFAEEIILSSDARYVLYYRSLRLYSKHFTAS